MAENNVIKVDNLILEGYIQRILNEELDTINFVEEVNYIGDIVIGKEFTPSDSQGVWGIKLIKAFDTKYILVGYWGGCSNYLFDTELSAKEIAHDLMGFFYGNIYIEL